MDKVQDFVKTILKYKSVKGKKKKMVSIKKVLLCPKSHLRQFILWLNLSVLRSSQGCEVDHAYAKSSYVGSSVRRNLFPHFPLVTNENFMRDSFQFLPPIGQFMRKSSVAVQV